MADVNQLNNRSSAVLEKMSDRLQFVCEQVRRGDMEWALRAASGLETALEELRTSEEELASARVEREAERERYSELFNLAPDCYFVTDLHGAILEANRSAVTMLAISE